MDDDCPTCGLDFDRGDPGHFTGAMYVSYALAIPWIALLTLIEHVIVPGWSLFRLVVLASLLSVPLIPWLLIFGFVWFFIFRQLRNSAGAARVLHRRELAIASS